MFLLCVNHCSLCVFPPSSDVDVQSPDEKSVITYVSTLYDAFPKVPDGVDGISANVSITCQEFDLDQTNYVT